MYKIEARDKHAQREGKSAVRFRWSSQQETVVDLTTEELRELFAAIYGRLFAIVKEGPQS